MGDSALHIGPRLIQGYEELSKPTSVALISNRPLAWRIESLMDVGPSGVYSPDQPRIFVVGEQRITLVSSSNADTYRRCSVAVSLNNYGDLGHSINRKEAL